MDSNSSAAHPSGFLICSNAKPLLLIAGLLLSLVGSSQALSAGEVDHVFDGTVTNVSNAGGTIVTNLSGAGGVWTIAVNDHFNASLRYDTSMPPTGSAPQSLIYSNFIFNFAVSLSPDESNITSRSLRIGDNTGVPPGPLSDDFLVSVHYKAGWPVTEPYIVSIHLSGPTNIFDSMKPPASLNLGDFDSARFSIENPNNSDRFDGTITGIRSYPVPEPTTFSLFALGVIGIALRFGRRCR